MNSNQKHSSILKLTCLSILTAIIAILQLTGTAIKFVALGTSVSLVLIPTVLGAVMLGKKSGAFLGFVFGMIVYLMGAFGMDPFTNILFLAHPVLTFLICIVKGVAAGYVSGLVYEKFKDTKKYLGIFLAAAVAPILNTGLFIIGGLTMQQTLSTVANGHSVIYFLVIVCAGLNFVFEFILNMVAAPAIYRILTIFGNKLNFDR